MPCCPALPQRRGFKENLGSAERCSAARVRRRQRRCPPSAVATPLSRKVPVRHLVASSGRIHRDQSARPGIRTGNRTVAYRLPSKSAVFVPRIEAVAQPFVPFAMFRKLPLDRAQGNAIRPAGLGSAPHQPATGRCRTKDEPQSRCEASSSGLRRPATRLGALPPRPAPTKARREPLRCAAPLCHCPTMQRTVPANRFDIPAGNR